MRALFARESAKYGPGDFFCHEISYAAFLACLHGHRASRDPPHPAARSAHPPSPARGEGATKSVRAAAPIIDNQPRRLLFADKDGRRGWLGRKLNEPPSIRSVAGLTLASRFSPSLAQQVDKFAEQLQNGEFNWFPERSPGGPVLIIVSIPDQLVYVYRNGVRIAASTCSTGKLGHRTPTGCSRSCRGTRTTISRPITMRRCPT
ncbi:MAG TPA: L,D-transpeptidase family protein [Roseiarcus sp.]